MKLLKNEYKFIKFEKSSKKDKKYTAILQNKKTSKQRKIHFGGIRKDGEPYSQFKDATGLGVYSKYNSNDKDRRARYRKRHSKEVPSFKDYWTAGLFSYKFLW